MKKRLGCCGVFCEECRHYPSECKGCTEIKGSVFWMKYAGENICDIYDCCINKKKYVHCGKCEEFPCDLYNHDEPTKPPEENRLEHLNQMKMLREYVVVENLVNNLQQKDSKEAYKSLKILEEKSQESNLVYLFIDNLIELIYSRNSYVRTRGLILIAANAKWDKDNKIDEIIDDYLKHIMDEKPITARQCIRVLPEIVSSKPELLTVVVDALKCAVPGRYSESMWPLLQKDIAEALKRIGGV